MSEIAFYLWRAETLTSQLIGSPNSAEVRCRPKSLPPNPLLPRKR
jgi:hypothetical protein